MWVADEAKHYYLVTGATRKASKNFFHFLFGYLINVRTFVSLSYRRR